MASTPAVLVGMPLSTDEVRTDLAVVQGAVVQGTPLTRQLSQSAISEASVNGVAETEGERFMVEWEKKVEEEIKAEDHYQSKRLAHSCYRHADPRRRDSLV